MITLTVTDPTAKDAAILRAIADAIAPATVTVISGTHVTNEEIRKTVRDMHGKAQAAMVTPVGGHVGGTIAPEDNPATGAEVLTGENSDMDAIFAAGAPPLPGAPALPNDPNLTAIPPPLQPPSSQTLTPPSTGAAGTLPPPPPPPAPAPENASGAATSTNGVQLDKDGLPWDTRIHASTQVINADGRWKKRRGVDAAVIVDVERQLHAAMAIPSPNAALHTEVAAIGITPPPVAVVTPPPPPPLADGAWPFPAQSPFAAPPAEQTFANLVAYVTKRVEAQTLTQAHIQGAVTAVGLEKLTLLMPRPDLVPAVWAKLAAIPE